MLDPERYLSTLNPAQREAVTHGEGPLLILAGAGSGKTRVITHRIAHLIGSVGVDPAGIVAMTFTNKAAGEMRTRVERLLGYEIGHAYVGTFHAFGLRLLRRHAAEAGYPPGFLVYDSADQRALVRQALRELGADAHSHPPKRLLALISRWKTGFVDPDEAEASARFPDELLAARCYRTYEERLRAAGAVDFDDLLVQVIRLFRRRPEIAARYARDIRYLLVDEYQDTNRLQYELIRLLTSQHRNLCCVGDEDQSIYAFRGADIRNILDFQRDFPDARIIKLEQNYRSTRSVLAAASAVISYNRERHGKTLWTENPSGEPIRLYVAADDREEADIVVSELLERSRTAGIPLERMAVLYRTNACSRVIEDRLSARGVPYRVVGSVRFYERKEIKDLLSWLRLLVQPDSDQDFLRAVAAPPRGVGARTLEELAARAAQDGTSLHAAMRALLSRPGTLQRRAESALRRFAELLDGLSAFAAENGVAATIAHVIDAVGYREHLEQAYRGELLARLENVEALVAAAHEHDESGAGGLAAFLDRVSLRSDTDDVRGDRGPSLMTVHSAKGLEFDGVFVIGLVEELFPHVRAEEQRGGIEEERRLMYVAITRARRFLVLTTPRARFVRGARVPACRSRFLDEIPSELLDVRYGPAGGGGRPVPAPPRERPSRTAAAGTARRAGDLTYEPDPASVSFVPGMRVVHPSFGPGTVLRASRSGGGLVLEIRFEHAGRRRILANRTTLAPA
ncbi:MAG: hypothetical protein D6718_02750 [Acidobacteria bacterium]|nr:MAG: hypothetical protein D6718_02750 [Acidobacteriota bacterium]